jgi:hypothetical protein
MPCVDNALRTVSSGRVLRIVELLSPVVLVSSAKGEPVGEAVATG